MVGKEAVPEGQRCPLLYVLLASAPPCLQTHRR